LNLNKVANKRYAKELKEVKIIYYCE